jgi:hypothetical protein
MFKVIGNGVPYKVAEGVAQGIKLQINRKLSAQIAYPRAVEVQLA